MFGLRGCGCFATAVVIVCAVGAVVLYAVGLPRFREHVREPMQQAVSTEVARQIAIAPNSAPQPGTYTIDQAELNSALQEQAGGELGIDSIATAIDPTGITIRIKIQSQTATYRGDVGAVGGRLVVANMTAEGGFRYFLPAGDMGKILENGINNYLTSRNLRLTDVTLGDGTMTLTTAPA
jgi:hypothetical protein